MSDRVVIDASVALKWLFDDEADLAPSRDLLARFNRRDIEFVVPPHWPLEVLNGIRTAVVKRRIEPERAQVLASDFIDLGIATTDITPHTAEIYRVAIELDRTVYDAAYVVLGERSGLDVVTADDKLGKAVSAVKPFVRHVRDYGGPDPPIPSLNAR